jgi:hypothetical protein
MAPSVLVAPSVLAIRWTSSPGSEWLPLLLASRSTAASDTAVTAARLWVPLQQHCNGLRVLLQRQMR